MPFITSIVQFPASMAKISFVLRSLVVVCSLATLLSGCSAIGSSKPAALQVTSKPETTIFLDGKHLGKTPFYNEQLKEGEYTLKLTASSVSYVEKINLHQNTLTVVNRELNSNPLLQSGENLSLVPNQKGIFIVSIPPEADVAIDGKHLGKTSFYNEQLENGDHRVLVSKDGFVDREFAIRTLNKYQLLTQVTLASQIAKGNVDISEEPQKPETKLVQILSTPQGFLRVRSEPSLSATEVGKVNSGDEHEIIQEIDEWYQISFAGKLGWISATYAKKL